MVKFKVVRLCKQEAMSIAPTETVRFDLDKATVLLEKKGYQVTSQGPMIIARMGDVEATLYMNGRMLISMVDTKERAGEIASTIYEAVEGSREPFSPKRS
jgi:hypothetical protein